MLKRSRVVLVVSTLIAVMALVQAGQASPIIPTIDGPEIGFAAQLRFDTRGLAPDLLTSQDASGDELMTKYEAGTYWPNYPSVDPATPLWCEEGGVRYYGADVRLAVEFTGSDAVVVPGMPVPVSLIGTGASTDPQVADVEIWGTTSLPGTPAVSELLWAVDLDNVSMVGYDGDDTFLLEGVGTLVGGSLAQAQGVVGQTGVIRGHIDLSATIEGGYDPVGEDVYEQGTASYSGETGVPEPASLALLAIGGLAVLRRRR